MQPHEIGGALVNSVGKFIMMFVPASIVKSFSPSPSKRMLNLYDVSY